LEVWKAVTILLDLALLSIQNRLVFNIGDGGKGFYNGIYNICFATILANYKKALAYL
jgi:hypothetical protein